jgi:amidase
VTDAFLDATAQADLVRRGDATAVELVEEAITRVEKLNGELNAVIVPLFDEARAAAQHAAGPFAGVPWVLKDLGPVSKGHPHAGGIAGAKAAGWVADHDSYLVEAMGGAGFVLVGKTNTPELGLVPTTEPAAWGASRNPYDTGRSTGGSSGGSAAAVASGMVPVGHANDGGGSIRIPASECGLVGLKPSKGRVSQGPTVTESWAGLSVDLAVTRTVRDTAAVLDVLSGRRAGDVFAAPAPARPYVDEVGADPGRLRIRFLTHDPAGTTPVDPACVAAVEATARALEAAGHDVAEGHPSALGESPVDDFVPCYAAWVATDLAAWGDRLGRAITEDDVEPGTWFLGELGKGVSATQYLAALDRLRRGAARIESWWDDHDILLTPTIPEPPPLLGDVVATERAAQIVAFTIPANITGQPAISVPVHQHAALPVGVQLVGGYGREDLLIRLASQLEQALPWADRRPGVSA